MGTISFPFALPPHVAETVGTNKDLGQCHIAPRFCDLASSVRTASGGKHLDNFNPPKTGALWYMHFIYDDDEALYIAGNLFEEWSSVEPDKAPRELLRHEIYYMTAMLVDCVLPVKGAQALGIAFMGAMKEIKEKKYTVDALKMAPPRPGRKQDPAIKMKIFQEVGQRLQRGGSKTKAYEDVATLLRKSPAHVRKVWEALEKKRRLKKGDMGKIKK